MHNKDYISTYNNTINNTDRNTMLNNILATKITQVSELKKSPMSIITEGNGETVAVLNRNEPVFYCVPAKQYEEMMEKLEDAHLVKIVQSRSKEKEIPVDIDEL